MTKRLQERRDREIIIVALLTVNSRHQRAGPSPVRRKSEPCESPCTRPRDGDDGAAFVRRSLGARRVFA